MKRFAVGLCTGGLALALLGCGSGTRKKKPAEPPKAKAPATKPEKPATTEKAGDAVKKAVDDAAKKPAP
jgi:hypothetical protein